MAINVNDLPNQMFEAGIAAQEAGKMNAPALCSVYMDAIDGLPVGGRIGRHTSISLAKHWQRGWHEANMKGWEEELEEMRREEEAEDAARM